MELAWSSVAALAMAPLQELLNLGKVARMNVPGYAEGNWRCRSMEVMLWDARFEWLRNLTRNASGRVFWQFRMKKTEESASKSKGS